jgi:hypothetical protein
MDLPIKDHTVKEDISVRYRKKNAPTPEKIARLRGHLSSRIALR